MTRKPHCLTQHSWHQQRRNCLFRCLAPMPSISFATGIFSQFSYVTLSLSQPSSTMFLMTVSRVSCFVSISMSASCLQLEGHQRRDFDKRTHQCASRHTRRALMSGHSGYSQLLLGLLTLIRASRPAELPTYDWRFDNVK